MEKVNLFLENYLILNVAHVTQYKKILFGFYELLIDEKESALVVIPQPVNGCKLN